MRASQDRAEGGRVGRVLVYGVTGSGKSVLAARIAELTGSEHVAVDDLCWRPGRVQVSPEEQRRVLGEACARDRWVLDSAWGVWTDVALPPVLRLRSPRETEEWLRRLASTPTVGGAT